jgi:hypothetical protein
MLMAALHPFWQIIPGIECAGIPYQGIPSAGKALKQVVFVMLVAGPTVGLVTLFFKSFFIGNDRLVFGLGVIGASLANWAIFNQAVPVLDSMASGWFWYGFYVLFCFLIGLFIVLLMNKWVKEPIEGFRNCKEDIAKAQKWLSRLAEDAPPETSGEYPRRASNAALAYLADIQFVKGKLANDIYDNDLRSAKARASIALSRVKQVAERIISDYENSTTETQERDPVYYNWLDIQRARAEGYVALLKQA